MEKSYINIVSGLPRSGTSMMMKAVQAGGIEVLIDNIRKADDDNPKGYYEFEPVKKTKDDPSWLSSASGKAVKMVYRLLYDLPADFQYRVVFMRRDISEVLASQKKMLQRSGKQGASIGDEKLAALFKDQLDKFEQWITEQENFSIIYINYSDMISQPQQQCRKINEFLGESLNADAMAAIVDPSLYRNRK